MEDFKQIRENLLDMLEDLDDRLSTITGDVKSADTPTPSLKNDELLDTVDESTQTTNQIKQAISRIEDGTFGICLNCGQAIKKSTLHTSPFLNQCPCCSENKDEQ